MARAGNAEEEDEEEEAEYPPSPPRDCRYAQTRALSVNGVFCFLGWVTSMYRNRGDHVVVPEVLYSRALACSRGQCFQGPMFGESQMERGLSVLSMMELDFD